MRAVDTNVVVRYLTADDEAQFKVAQRLIENEPIHVSVTVLLETEWVLRRAAGLAKNVVLDMLRQFAGLPTVTVEDCVQVSDALRWAEKGFDFADAIHLSRAGHCSGMATFDRDFIRLGAAADAIPVTLP